MELQRGKQREEGPRGARKVIAGGRGTEPCSVSLGGGARTLASQTLRWGARK